MTPELVNLRFRCIEAAIAAGARGDNVLPLALRIERYVGEQPAPPREVVGQ